MDDEEYTVDLSEDDFFELTEKLLDADYNNCSGYFRYNLQERRCGVEDVCDEPLFSDVDESIFEVKTIKALIALHDNYEPLVSEEEDVTREEIQEEYDFLDACMETQVFQIAKDFMVEKGVLGSDDPELLRRILHRMWFALYPRDRRTKGSCAFEHVFLGEIKRGKTSGFHNWLFFLMEEQKGDVNYYGFSKKLSFGQGKGGIMKTVFEWEGAIKPVSSIFMALSPELELALYTLCVLLKPDDNCTVSLGGKTIDIQTYTFKHGGKKYLSSAFPDF